MPTVRRSGFLALFLAIAAPAAAQERPHTPAPGTAERRELMDALRIPVQRDLGKPVIFEVRTLRVLGTWAFMDGLPRQPGGQPFDYRGTKYQEAIDEGMFDDGMFAIMRREGGVWRVVFFAIGSTDVGWFGMDEELGAPRAIFPYPP